MKNIFISLFLLSILGCTSVFQYSSPRIEKVNSIKDIPNAAQPIFLDSPKAFGKYYMEIEKTNNIPNFGWIAIESNIPLIYSVIPAYPNPINKKIVGVAKEPAYKVQN